MKDRVQRKTGVSEPAQTAPTPGSS